MPPFPSFCGSPTSLDAFVFSYLALILQAKLPSGKLQVHVRALPNLCAYCTHILGLYFPWDGGKERRGMVVVEGNPESSPPTFPWFSLS